MLGPSYQCRAELANGIIILSENLIYYGNQTLHEDHTLFEANWTKYSNYSLRTLSTQLEYNSISCVTFFAAYNLNVSYPNGLQSVISSMTLQNPLPFTNLSDPALFDPQVERTANGTLLSPGSGTANQGLGLAQEDLLMAVNNSNPYGYIFTRHVQALDFNNSKILPGPMNATTALELSSIRALHDALARALGGGIARLASITRPDVASTFQNLNRDTSSATTSNTTAQVPVQFSTSLILDSNPAGFSALDPTAVWLDITSSSLQDLITNITISLLTIPHTKKRINVIMSTSRNVHSFARPWNMLLPYAVTLSVSLLFAGIGLVMLLRNGTRVDSYRCYVTRKAAWP